MTATLIRRVSFSSGHRYWKLGLDEAENRKLYGPWASPYNHGHNYVLDVAAEGKVDPVTGMVVNIKDIDAVLQQEVVQRFNQRSINDEIPHFADRAPSIENLLDYIALLLKEGFVSEKIPATIVHLRLEEMPGLWGELDTRTNMTTLTRSYEFAAAHRLHVPSFTDSKNVELFGKCNNEAGHGHNYVVEVTVSGDVDPATGMALDILALDHAVEERVVERYDHKNLNVDLPEFVGKVTTSEVITQEIWKALDGSVPGRLERVRLHETARSFFEITR